MHQHEPVDEEIRHVRLAAITPTVERAGLYVAVVIRAVWENRASPNDYILVLVGLDG